MAVDTFVSNPGSDRSRYALRRRRADSSRRRDDVGVSQPAAAYTGTFNVTVAYN